LEAAILFLTVFDLSFENGHYRSSYGSCISKSINILKKPDVSSWEQFAPPFGTTTKSRQGSQPPPNPPSPEKAQLPFLPKQPFNISHLTKVSKPIPASINTQLHTINVTRSTFQR
jgi:hypothetical protein